MNNIKYRRHGILAEFHDKKLDDFINNREAYIAVHNYGRDFDLHKQDGLGLLIYGPNGVGKSHLANVLAKHLINEHSVFVFHSVSQLVSIIAKSWKDEEVKEVLDDIIQRDLIIIDEFSKLPTAKDLAVTEMFKICKFRMTDHKPIIVVTNSKPAELNDIFGESMYSLLREYMIPVLVEGEDFRAKKLQINKQRFSNGTR